METGCKICQKYKIHYNQDHVNGNGMEFYDIMSGDFHRQMTIPERFAKHCRRLPETVDLKGPNGKIWSVELQKTADDVLFKQGWKEFVQAHHILERDLLVFRYDGSSCFEILIFDQSCCKKPQPNLLMDEKLKKLQMSDNSAEILNAKSRHEVIVGSSSSSPQNAASKKKAASDYQEVEETSKKGIKRRNELPLCAEKKKKKSCSDVEDEATKYNIKKEFSEFRNARKVPTFYISQKKTLSGRENKRVLKLVGAVQPINPCFVSIITSGSIDKRCFLYVPIGFKEHLPSRNCTIFLQMPNQRVKWSVNLCIYEKIVRFCWESFVMDNSIQIEDICLFERIMDDSEILLMVHILRAKDQDDDY